MATNVSLLLKENIDLVTRCHIYGACLRLVLMYCCGTSAQTKKKKKSRESANMKALGRLTRNTYKDRVTSEAVIKMTDMIDLAKLQVPSRLQWYGQVHQRKITMR